jgi:hypothetical protein
MASTVVKFVDKFRAKYSETINAIGPIPENRLIHVNALVNLDTNLINNGNTIKT